MMMDLYDEEIRKYINNFQWGSCSDDVNYGERFSTRILDTLENPNTQNRLINLWNYKIGREGVTEGYNGTIFAYGQTGCGKSYSMQGVVHPKSQIGIIPRAFTQIFNKINISGNIKYLITISYLEIYNEIIYDLFGKNKNSKLELKEHPEYGVYVQDLSMHTCSSIDECQSLIEKGWRNRATGSTQMNKCSSRSHAIFTMKLDRIEVDQNEKDHIRQGKLNLVDLAGSERQSKSG
ncbi:hypothetical protein A3Q56_07436 [Intoshia linei]|uniref:Kinesin motor domain-containing protein n=1 Tax=Intoshia linei TaxID=1819745 RepID=A0A177AS61_9BILA|nr:hypothetical protein A3Q56_07436 [Intoshia linei]